MSCDFLYEKDSYGWGKPKKATKHDIEFGEVARCGKETDSEYLDFQIGNENYLVDLCSKHKESKITKEMVLENDNLLTSGKNYTWLLVKYKRQHGKETWCNGEKGIYLSWGNGDEPSMKFEDRFASKSVAFAMGMITSAVIFMTLNFLVGLFDW